MAHANPPKARDTPLSPGEVRSRDIDNKSPLPSSGAVIASPPTENEASSPPRQKRWATKTRTGCITCRIRRVKCDEAKPMCKRCMNSGRMCDGYKAVPKKTSKQNAANSTYEAAELQTSLIDSTHAAYQPGPKSRFILAGSHYDIQCSLVPPDWDLVEAFDYYESTVTYRPTASNLGCKTSFITFIFSNRIADAAKNRGTLRSPEDMPNDQYLWTAFHASMISMLAIINERLSSTEGSVNDSVFVRIVDMLSIDLTLLGSTWQAHLHGYGALYRMRGGYKRLSKTLRDYNHQFQYVLM
ncbi:hypothetical protein NLG97_g4097 [Lecanicillium saksenae]|uniref:Uncharacterized protein n=1 Tax=Lecanicillium saksenae TaxID=468837 RepID=A0ACC1QWT7_9HYPO|nr:hypothetical protein NLG97_g4097 [Lecanicillium saksenae]